MKDYNVTIVFENGSYSHTENFKAWNKSDILSKIGNDVRKEADKIVTITILEKKPFNEGER